MYRARTPPQGVCDNSVCTLKLIASTQPGGSKAGANSYVGLQEASPKTLSDELRRLIAVENVEAVKEGELMK